MNYGHYINMINDYALHTYIIYSIFMSGMNYYNLLMHIFGINPSPS